MCGGDVVVSVRRLGKKKMYGESGAKADLLCLSTQVLARGDIGSGEASVDLESVEHRYILYT